MLRLAILAVLLSATGTVPCLARTDTVNPVGLPIPDRPDGLDLVTARTVRGILDFTRWPDNPPRLRLCITGMPGNGAMLDQLPATRGRSVLHRLMPSDSPNLGAECDALYIGALSLAERRRLTALVRNAAVLTISEDEPACRSGAMFCLFAQAGQLSFRLNIDAVSRSLVRVDPRVLRLAKGA